MLRHGSQLVPYMLADIRGHEATLPTYLFASRYLNAIQTMCPHILRYLTTAVITNKGRRQKVLKDLVKVIQQVSCSFLFFALSSSCHCRYENKQKG